MARKAAKISVEELQEKINALCKNDEDYDGNYLSPYTDFPDKVVKDLSKVSFDYENFYWQKSDEYSYWGGMFGCQQREDLVFQGCLAGGDWEFPVYFIIYFDGKNLRGYIPKDGNVWNRKTKEAFGNNDTADIDEIWKQQKKDDPALEEEDKAWVGSDGADIFLNTEKIIADILTRIQVT